MLSRKKNYLFLVPACNATVLENLKEGMEKDPDIEINKCKKVLEGFLAGKHSLPYCDCLMRFSLCQFYSWTGVDASTCSPTGYISFKQEQERCAMMDEYGRLCF